MKQILIVNANYYDKISRNLISASKKILILKKTRVKIFNVTGVFEIPVAIKKNIKKFDAFVALGCVIKGKTPHFDFICNAVAQGITTLNIKFHKPVVFGVLTTQTLQQAIDRSGGKHGNKGDEAAMTGIKMLNII